MVLSCLRVYPLFSLPPTSHGANARIRNKDGATPCELAMKLKHDSIVTCFATYVGAGLLDKLCKPQPSLTL